MSLKKRLKKWADGVKPRVVHGLDEVRSRLDDLNGSLASRSIPEERRRRVSELSLRNKAESAGQKLTGNGPENGSEG